MRLPRPVVAPPPADTTGSAGRRRLLATCAVVDIAWLRAWSVVEGGGRWLPLLAVIGTHAALVVAETRHPRLSRGEVLAATSLVAVGAVLLPPAASQDLWLYSFYGRMAGVHHLNPFVTPPAAVDFDPTFSRVAPAWANARCPYGPLVVTFGALTSVVAGTGMLPTRLAFQGLAAIALVGSVALLARRGVGTATLCLVGLFPPLILAVNEAHLDVVAGALLLLGVALVVDGRPGPAGVALAAALLVKATVGPAVIVIVVALVMRRRHRAAAIIAGIAAAPVVAAYALLGGVDALAGLRDAADHSSRASLWGGSRRLAARLDWEGPLHWLRDTDPAQMSRIGGLAGVVLVGLVLLRRRDDPEPSVLAAAALSAVLLGAAYVLPWYPTQVLPVAALLPRGAVRGVVIAHATVMLVFHIVPPGDVTQTVPGGTVLELAAAPVTLLLAVWLVVGVARQRVAAPGGGPDPRARVLPSSRSDVA